MHRPRRIARLACLCAATFILTPSLPVTAQDFAAVRGDRASGWLPQTRSEVLAREGVVATSHPLGAQAGLDILRRGGNAIDAAVAAAAVMNVVEPGSAGIGGDMFAIVWLEREHRLIAINGSGRAPSGATLAHIASRSAGPGMPQHGIDSATVPGAVDGWDQLLRRAGTMGFRQVLEPAVQVATRGFAVTERIHNDWLEGVELLRQDPDSAAAYLVGGAAPATYSVFRNPDLARAFRALQRGGRDAFYRGEIARAILAKSRALGGTFTPEDLAATHATWETPITTRYHGVDVYEMPPNTQGFAVLEMLNILDECTRTSGGDLRSLGPRSPQYWHVLVEAKKLAYADLYAFNGDPGFTPVPLERLLSKDYAASLCPKIDRAHAGVPEPRGDPVGGTVYLATADRWGNMVSFIYSIYDTFGSGVTVPGYGFVLNDRGALFSRDPASPNHIAPGKRPFHTLVPGFLMKAGEPLAVFGLMGGGQQAQGHAQVLVDMIDLGANAQAASDAARFAHGQADNVLHLESALYDLVGVPLRALGHAVEPANGEDMGGYQAIFRVAGPGAPGGGGLPVYRAASDHRKDGQAAGW